jgi:hypothetical protein
MAYKDVISNLNPDFWWELNGDVTDSGSQGNDGSGDPSYVDSIVPAVSSSYQCGDYDGATSTNIPDNSLINSVDTYEKSISVWIVCDTIDTTGNGRSIWAEGATTNNLALYTYNDGGTGTIYFKVMETSETYVDYVSYSPIYTGTLYHVGVTMEMGATTGSLYMYINGAQVDSKTGGLNVGNYFASHAAGAIGLDYNVTDINGNTLSGIHDGRIADLAYWGEQAVLTLSDFNSIYEAGVGAWQNISKFNGVLPVSMSKVNGLSVLSVSKLNGITV